MTEFSENKPIYLQIADHIGDRILRGELKEEDRIPSVRELGADLGVNPNTVMRSYDRLTDEGVLFNKRGIGYFIAPDARKRVLEERRRAFLEEDLPLIREKMALLGLDSSVFIESKA